MKRRFAKIYAVICALLLLAGFLAVFLFAWKADVSDVIQVLIGLFLGFVLAPVLHELGHVTFAAASQMDCVYVKCFCFKIYLKEGKKRFGFASPFSSDQTQVLPKMGGDMKRRALAYTIGGLVFSLIFIVAVLVSAILVQILAAPNYLLWGILPYPIYLFILNVLPLEYPQGKTDIGVYVGIKRNADVEKNMLAAMEIQGQLFEGKSFSEIDENLYMNVPQLCEDEPMFALMLDLRYRYYLEKQDMENAAACLNRLAMLQPYLTEMEIKKIAAELTYMHSLNKDFERLSETSKICREVLLEETATAKRILAAYSYAIDKIEAVPTFKAQAEQCLAKERIKGLAKFERILLSRIAEE